MPPSQRQTNFPDDPENVVTQFANRTFDFFSYPAELFRDINANFLRAVDLAVYLDVVFRIAQTIMTINKYWNMSSIGKPPGDARVDEITGKKWGLKASPQQKMAARLTSPAVLNAISIIFVALLTTAFWTLYSPFFEAFADGCIDHGPDDILNGLTNGTMIFRNSFTLSFGFAVQEGDDIVTTNVDELNVKRELDCEREFRETAERFENQLNLFNAIKRDFDSSLEFRNELVSCLRLDAVDAVGDPPVLLEEELFDDAFFTDFIELRDAVYNCSAIPVCPISCDDPLEFLIRNSVFDQSCAAELWFHASLLGSMLVVFTFVST